MGLSRRILLCREPLSTLPPSLYCLLSDTEGYRQHESSKLYGMGSLIVLCKSTSLDRVE